MKQILLLFGIAFGVLPVAAQSIYWSGGEDRVDIGREVSVLKDESGGLTIEQVRASGYRERFIPSGQSILHFGFTESIVWLHFTIDNPTKDSLLLDVDHAFIPEADLYINTGTVIHSGFNIPLGQKPIVNAEQVFPLPSGRHEYYLRIRPYVHAFPLTLWEKSHFHVHASRQKMIYGIYSGLLFFAIAINLFLFYTFRRRYYLNYAVLVFLYILSSALVMEGYAIYFFPTIDLMFWYRLVPVLDMPALLFYILSFLEVKRYDPALHRLTRNFGFGLLGYIAVLEFLPLMPVLVADQLLALSVFVLAITIGVRTGRRGNALGYYFVGAYSIWFTLINMELVYIQTGIPPHIGPISYVSTAIFIESFLLAWLLIQRFRWEKQEDQRLQAEMQAHINKIHQEYQHALLSSRIEMQEQTFQQISQEIHDNIGQILSLAKLHIATMESGGDPQQENKIRDAKMLVTKAIQDLRNLSHRLNTDQISELGFDTAVKEQLDIIRQSDAYQTRFTVEGRPFRFDPQKEIILFRILQELLNNILKHAQATNITVQLNYTPEELAVTIQDDGHGFDIEAAFPASTNGHDRLDSLPTGESQGLGIRSMYHRARVIGASLQIVSAPGAGTVALIRIPFSTNSQPLLQHPPKTLTL